MAVKDKNGVELKVGDLVTITARVTQTFEGDGNNIVVETVDAIVGSHPATFHTEGGKLTAVAGVKPPVPEVAAPAVSVDSSATQGEGVTAVP